MVPAAGVVRTRRLTPACEAGGSVELGPELRKQCRRRSGQGRPCQQLIATVGVAGVTVIVVCRRRRRVIESVAGREGHGERVAAEQRDGVPAAGVYEQGPRRRGWRKRQELARAQGSAVDDPGPGRPPRRSRAWPASRSDRGLCRRRRVIESVAGREGHGERVAAKRPGWYRRRGYTRRSPARLAEASSWPELRRQCRRRSGPGRPRRSPGVAGVTVIVVCAVAVV